MPDYKVPTREEAFDAFCLVIAYAAGQRADPRIFTQYALPPDARSADAYKRRHRALREGKVPGVWVRGKIMACTPDAWATKVPRRRSARQVVDPARHVDAELDAALGIRTWAPSNPRRRAKLEAEVAETLGILPKRRRRSPA
jgi:hypothetical protein